MPDGNGRTGERIRGGWAGPGPKASARRPVAPADQEATPPEDSWAEEAGVTIADELAAVAEQKGTVSLMLAGGVTPQPVYAWMARAGGVSWDHVDLYFGDERCVPPDHPDSNFRMVREALLDPAGIDPERVRRIPGESEDPFGAADRYAELLPERVDVLLLGIGRDGHVASLYPRSPALGETHRLVTAVTEPSRRITVTPRVIDHAERIFVLARGESKAEAVARALEGEWAPEECPAQLARRGRWLLDPEAASRLTAVSEPLMWGGPAQD